MPIKVMPEPHPEPPYERCCFCRAPTKFWIVAADVACCPECADRAHPSDVPSKEEWCHRERISGHTYADMAWRSKGLSQGRR